MVDEFSITSLIHVIRACNVKIQFSRKGLSLSIMLGFDVVSQPLIGNDGHPLFYSETGDREQPWGQRSG